ncbi:hypothetical protein R3P38DRAFT_3223440 [Favolaschia claudopus]|uniref:Uncharacterized protein n=1 Tax=Favolaschia claudopus TaxID=2862362 RepID=A0AAV9ZWV1_9AGAR
MTENNEVALHLTSSQPPQHLAPHIVGYFGEHISNYPAGTRQLSGSLLSSTPSDAVEINIRPRLYQRKASPASNSRYLEIDDHSLDLEECLATTEPRLKVQAKKKALS